MAMARRQDDRSQEERSTLVKRSTKTRRTYRRRKKRGKAKVRPLNDDEAEVSTTTTTLSITQWSEKLSSGSSIDMGSPATLNVSTVSSLSAASVCNSGPPTVVSS